MRRRILTTATATMAFMALAAPVFACGGLIGPRGSVDLVRTTTLAAYHQGIEHYITAFRYTGDGGEFGSIVPLPGVPTKVERGGDWTLQRLVNEVTPVPEAGVLFAGAAADTAKRARVILEAEIDALDITVLEGGADEVALWAADAGFVLPDDAADVLTFYAERSPIFMAARFNGARAAERGQQIGDGTPLHVTIPTTNPWVPLRILGLGAPAEGRVEADVFLLTDREPATLPAAGNVAEPGALAASDALTLNVSREASGSLLADLRSDTGMDWLPAHGMWLSHFVLDGAAPEVTFDLAIDASGFDAPSPVAAGLARALDEAANGTAAWWLAAALATVAVIAIGRRRVTTIRHGSI